MKVLLDTTPLLDGNSGRGIGTYTRHLLTHLRQLPRNEPLVVQATHDLDLPVISPEESFDLVHYPYFDLFYATLPRNHKIPFIVTVHDVIPLLFPQHFPKGVKGTLRFYAQKWKLQQAAKIITDSEASKKGIMAKLGIPGSSIRVIPLAGNPEIQELS